MKLVFAIINNDDSGVVATNLTKNGFSVTRLNTTGGFLKKGNTTFIIGAADEMVDEVISIINAHSKKRSQVLGGEKSSPELFGGSAVEVKVGGAVIFVTDVERFERC